MRLSKRFNGKRARFVSAMGSWGWDVAGRERGIEETHPSIKSAAQAIQAACDDYGYEPIPVVYVTVENGQVSKKYDW